MNKEIVKVFCIAAVILLPLFFINYRTLAFHTLPFDDYHSFILYLNGEKSDFEFYAPTGYRFLSYGVMALIYKIMPLISLSQFSEQFDTSYYRALQAQAFSAYVFQVFFFVLTFLLCRIRLNYERNEALLVGAISLGLSFITAFFGVDHMVMCVLLLILIFKENRLALGLILLISIGINEKILLFSFLYFGLETAYAFLRNKRKPYLNLLMSVTGVIGYFIVRSILDLPGYEYQTDISTFNERMSMSWNSITSFKGLYTNLLPPAILLYITHTANQQKFFDVNGSHPLIFMILILAVFFLGMFVSSDYTIGRTCFQLLPFFIPLIAYILSEKGK